MFTCFGFCSCYSIAYSVPPNFNINDACLKDIKSWYSKTKELGGTKFLGMDKYEYNEEVKLDNDEDKLTGDSDIAAAARPFDVQIIEDPFQWPKGEPSVGKPTVAFRSPSKELVSPREKGRRDCRIILSSQKLFWLMRELKY